MGSDSIITQQKRGWPEKKRMNTRTGRKGGEKKRIHVKLLTFINGTKIRRRILKREEIRYQQSYE